MLTQTNRVLELHEVIKATEFEHAENMIHLHVGGSELHGAQTGSQDLDIVGVYIQPPYEALGITEFRNSENSTQRYRVKTEHFDWSTAGDRKNTSSDIDVVAYSLRKWAGLAAKGHPEALHCLFVPNLGIRPGMWEKHIRPHAAVFLSAWAGNTFQSCANEQWDRLNREQTKDTNYKMAMHVLRLLQEGTELLRTGRITFPNPERDLLLQVREGKLTLRQIEKFVTLWTHELETARAHSVLPADVDRRKISDLIANTYLDFYTGGLWPLPKLPVRHCAECQAELYYGNNVCPNCGFDNEDK